MKPGALPSLTLEVLTRWQVRRPGLPFRCPTKLQDGHIQRPAGVAVFARGLSPLCPRKERGSSRPVEPWVCLLTVPRMRLNAFEGLPSPGRRPTSSGAVARASKLTSCLECLVAERADQRPSIHRRGPAFASGLMGRSGSVADSWEGAGLVGSAIKRRLRCSMAGRMFRSRRTP